MARRNEELMTQQTTQVSRAYVAQPLVDALNQIDTLPVATLTPVWTQNPATGSMETAKDKQAIWVGGSLSEIVSDRYTLVQHREAFEPVLNALVFAGQSDHIKARMAADKAKAHLDCIVDDELTDTVRLGFRVDSVLDGAHSIRYSFSSQKVSRFIEKVEHKTETSADAPLANGAAYRYIELVGFRQSCANGMKVRVPVAEAELALKSKSTPNFGVGSYSIRNVITDIWTESVQRETAVRLASTITNIKHTASAPELVKQQRQAVALMLAMRDPVRRLIERAEQATYATPLEALDALSKVVGESKAKQIWHANRVRSPEFYVKFVRHESTMTAWDLYNAMTFYSTHILPEGNAKELVENQAADYLVLLTGAKLPNSTHSASVSI